jgi:hypothetical protein
LQGITWAMMSRSFFADKMPSPCGSTFGRFTAGSSKLNPRDGSKSNFLSLLSKHDLLTHYFLTLNISPAKINLILFFPLYNQRMHFIL